MIENRQDECKELKNETSANYTHKKDNYDKNEYKGERKYVIIS